MRLGIQYSVLAFGVGVLVSNWVSVVFSNNLTGNNANAELRARDNGLSTTVTIYGTVSGWQPQFLSTNGSGFYLANTTGNASSSGTAHAAAKNRNDFG